MKRLLSLLGCILLNMCVLHAQTAKPQTPIVASHHSIVVDLTTVLSDGWAMTLSNVESLKRNFKNDAEIELFVHGPAVSMLHRDDTDFADRIRRLHDAGVHFI